MARSRIERMLNEVRITNHGKIAVLTIAAAVVAVVVGVTSLTSSELTAADTTRAQQTGDTAAPLQTNTGSSYFPRQHDNQAAEASEHIQAF